MMESQIGCLFPRMVEEKANQWVSTDARFIHRCFLTITVDSWNKTWSSLQCAFLSPVWLAFISTDPHSILSLIHQRRSTRIELPYLPEWPLYQPDHVNISETPSNRHLSDEVSLQDWGYRIPKGRVIPITFGYHRFGWFNAPLVSKDTWTRPIRCRSSGTNRRHTHCREEITGLERNWIAGIIWAGLWTTLRCGSITFCLSVTLVHVFSLLSHIRRWWWECLKNVFWGKKSLSGPCQHSFCAPASHCVFLEELHYKIRRCIGLQCSAIWGWGQRICHEWQWRAHPPLSYVPRI